MNDIGQFALVTFTSIIFAAAGDSILKLFAGSLS